MAHGTQIKACNSKGFRSNLAVPRVESAEVEIWFSVRQPAGLDGVEIVDQEQEDIAVAGIKRRRIFGDVDEGIVAHRRPVQDARHFPHRVAGPIAGDLHHRRDQFVIPDAAVFGSRHRAQFEPAIVHLERFYQLGTVIEQAVLQVDRGKRRGELPHVARRCTDQAAELTVAPVGRCDRLALTWNEKFKPLRIVARSLDADRGAFDRSGMGAVSAGPDRVVEIVQRQEAFVIRARKPFGRNAANPFAAGDIDFETGGSWLVSGCEGIHLDCLHKMKPGAVAGRG